MKELWGKSYAITELIHIFTDIIQIVFSKTISTTKGIKDILYFEEFSWRISLLFYI